MSEKKEAKYEVTRQMLGALLVQVAAESFLDDILDQDQSQATIASRLINGPNHFDDLAAIDDLSATQSTDFMTNEFFNTWMVLHQLPNTSSHFSPD